MGTVYSSDPSRKVQAWNRQTIREIHARTSGSGQAENLLESLIAEQPELLGITAKYDESNIDGPFVVFSQRDLPALNGGTIKPDLILLSRSGHVVVVEVKLEDNVELKGRRTVVGQLLEYAACLSHCSEADFVRMFKREDRQANTWTERIAELFDVDMESAERLAGQFLAKFRDRDLELIIACDKVPVGLRELIRSIVAQKAIGDYKFRVVEIIPFVRGDDFDNFILVPEVNIQTEIVARTVVTVAHKGVQQKPSIDVYVTSLEEAEAQRHKAVERFKSQAWDEKSYFERAGEQLDKDMLAAVRGLYDEIKARGYSCRWGRGRNSGSFSVIIPRVSDKPAFTVYSDGGFCINFIYFSEADEGALRETLRKMPGIECSESPLYPFVKGWTARWREILAAIEEPTSA